MNRAHNKTPGIRQSGVAVIEFALVLLFLLLIVVGITEIGRAFWYYSALLKSTRDAARCISQVDISTANEEQCIDVAAAAAASAGVRPTPSGSDYQVNYTNDSDGNTEYVTVTANLSMRWIWSPTSSLSTAGSGVPINVQTTMPYLY